MDRPATVRARQKLGVIIESGANLYSMQVDMAPIDLQSGTAKFFDDFVEAFGRFDGDLIAARYAAPYLAMQADCSTRLFVENQEISRYFQSVVDSYHQQGCRSCRYSNLEVVALGYFCSLATMTWELLTAEDNVLSEWRESYSLMRVAEGLRIFASVDHAGEFPA